MAIKQKRSEPLVGLFILVGGAILATLILKFGKFTGNNQTTYEVDLTFKDASGLIKGSEVRMGGARIGKVINTPELQDDLRVKVILKLNERIKIDKSSAFQIQSLSIIGDKMIIVTPPEKPSGIIIKDGDSLKGGAAGGLDAIASDAESVARDARVLMKDARTTLLKVDSALDDIRAVAGRLAESIEKVNTEVLDDKNIASIKKSIKNIESVTASFKDLGDDIKPTLAEARKTLKDVGNAAKAAETTFNTANVQLKKIEPALASIPGAVDSFKLVAKKASKTLDTTDETMRAAKQTLANLNKSDGLLKTLSQDKEFDADTKKFVKNLKHHGILRYKDTDTADPKDPKENRYRSKRRR